MLRFFRQIRKNLMEQNKVQKYLLYAIGEIALVMIGILLALQVNTWNEARKNSSEEDFYLNKLRDTLVQDTLKIRIDRNWLRLYHSELDTIEANMKNGVPVFDVNPVIPLKSVIYYTADFSTWGNLQSTGKINLIEDPALSDLLYQYYGNQVEIEERKAILFDFTRDKIIPFLVEFDGMDDPQKSPAEYQSSLVFKNIIFLKRDAMNGALSALDRNLNNARVLLTLIEEELIN